MSQKRIRIGFEGTPVYVDELSYLRELSIELFKWQENVKHYSIASAV